MSNHFEHESPFSTSTPSLHSLTSTMDPSSALTYSTPMAPSLSTSSSIITPYHLPLLTMSHYSGLYTTTSTTTTSSTTSSVPFLIGASSHYLVTRSSSIEQKQSTLTHLNMTSQLLSHLFEPTNVSSVPMSSDIGYTAKSAMSQLENQTEEISLLDNLDTSLYLSVSQNALVSVILGAIMVFTIIGNLMVIWAIFNYRPLHNVQNMFLVSLAVSDIAVAVLVMPFNVAYNLLGKWIFGLHLCEMWLTSDVMSCTASILNLCAIALDRYQAIHDPINYAQKRTMRRVCTSIGIVWILSAIISIPPLIGWNDWPEEFNDETPCKLSEEKSYLIYSSSGSFYIPLLIMTVVYFKIFKATRRRLKDRAKASAMANLKHSTTTTVSTSVIHHVNHIAKSSSNEDSFSSGSPKAPRTFSHIKSRCIRCCGVNRSHMHDRVDHTERSNGKNKNRYHKKCIKAMAKETRIEIESASDEIDHSRNDISSSDMCGMTTTGQIVSAETNDCGQQAQMMIMESNNNGTATISNVPDNGEHKNNSNIECSSSPAAIDCVDRSNGHSSISLNNDCYQLKHSLPLESNLTNDAALNPSNSNPEGSQFACIVDSQSLNEPIIRIDRQDGNHHTKTTTRVDIDLNGTSGQNEISSEQNTTILSESSNLMAKMDCHFHDDQMSSHANNDSVSLSKGVVTPELGALVNQTNSSKSVSISAPNQVSVKKFWEEKQKISLSRERRATRILGIVMGVFVACWLPFFLMYVIMPFCDSCYLSNEMQNFITWLGYINSALNPLIYCGFNRDFRRAFQRILSCKKV